MKFHLYSEMLHEKTGDIKEKREEQLQIIISETDRLTKLVNNILDLSKLQTHSTTAQVRHTTSLAV